MEILCADKSFYFMFKVFTFLTISMNIQNITFLS